jgi:hypothetical protein
MMRDKKALAVIVGDAWAKRMVEKQQSEGSTTGGPWPGRAEDIAVLARPLSDVTEEQQILGLVILRSARRAWRTLTTTRTPPPTPKSRKRR